MIPLNHGLTDITVALRENFKKATLVMRQLTLTKKKPLHGHLAKTLNLA